MQSRDLQGLNGRIKTRQSRIRAFFALPVLALLVSACDVSQPQLPSFDSHLTIPLGSERFTVAEAVSDDPSLLVDADGGISFFTGSDPDTLPLGMDLNIEIPAQHINQAIGSFSIASPAPVEVIETIADAWPEALDLAGTSTPIAPFDFSIEASDLQLDGIETCTLSSGIVTLAVSSSWPVSISGSGTDDPMELILVDGETGIALLTSPLDPLAAHGANETVISLAGITLPGHVKIILSGHGDGTGEDSVAVTGQEELVLQLSFTNMIATSATAAIAPQTFDMSFITELGSQNGITSADFGSGTLAFDLHNELPFPVIVEFLWDRVITPEGLPLGATAELAPGADTFLDIAFADCRIDDEGTPLTSLTAHVNARTSGSDGVPVTLTSTQGFGADLQPGVLTFSTIQGCFEPTSWELEPSTEQITYPDDSEGFEFTRATLTIDLNNSADMGADLDLTITGNVSQGDPVSLEIHDRVDPSGGGSLKSVLVLDENNSALVDFLNSRPRIITLAGTMSLIPGASCGTVLATDQLIVSWNLEVPLVVNLNGATLSGDPQALGLDTTLRDMITDHVGAAEFRATVLNHIPAGLQLMVLVAGRQASLPAQPELVIGPIDIASAQVDPASGETSAAVTSHPLIQLTPAEAGIFGQADVQTMYQIVLPSAGDTPIRILSTDFLEISGTVSFELRIDEEI